MSISIAFHTIRLPCVSRTSLVDQIPPLIVRFACIYSVYSQHAIVSRSSVLWRLVQLPLDRVRLSSLTEADKKHNPQCRAPMIPCHRIVGTRWLTSRPGVKMSKSNSLLSKVHEAADSEKTNRLHLNRLHLPSPFLDPPGRRQKFQFFSISIVFSCVSDIHQATHSLFVCSPKLFLWEA